MKCYNSFCPFRMNDDDDENSCKCECCPNRVKTEGTYKSNSTIMFVRGTSNGRDKFFYSARTIVKNEGNLFIVP